jgi:hypothetical protein
MMNDKIKKAELMLDTRMGLKNVGRILTEICEKADDDVYDYLSTAFSDWQGEIIGSLEDVAYVFLVAADDKYNEWKEKKDDDQG